MKQITADKSLVRTAACIVAHVKSISPGPARDVMKPESFLV